MPFEFEASDDLESGNWLKEPGTYHVAIDSVNEFPVSAKGVPLTAFKVNFQVLEGEQKDKTIEILFWNPKSTAKDGGKFARQKQTKFMIAAGLLDMSQLGQRKEINLEAARGSQCIAKIVANEQEDGRVFMDLSWSDIWHIDDPAAPKCPLNSQAVELLPPTKRKHPSSFKTAKAAASPPPPNPNSGAIDLSGL